MMSYKYGALMAGWGTFGFLTELVVLIDLILLGIWLYKQVTKE